MKRGVTIALFIAVLFVSFAVQLRSLDKGQWIHQGRAERKELVNVTLALTLRNVNDLEVC